MLKISTAYFKTDRIIHSFKITLAILVGFLITHYVRLQFDQWLIVAIIVVMCGQISVGGMLYKAYMRFLGTFAGSIIAACVLLLFKEQTWAVITVIASSAWFFSFIATSDQPWSEAGTLGIATLVIILMGQHPTIYTAGIRTLEISLGILIAALISQFVLPIHATAHIRRLQALTITQLKHYYLAIINFDDTIHYTENKIQGLDENIIVLLQAQRKLAKEATQEILGFFNMRFFKQLLWCEKEILRTIDFMHQSYKRLPDHALEILNYHLAGVQFNQKITEAFTQSLNLLAHKKLLKANQTDIEIQLPKFGKITEIPATSESQLPIYELTQISTFLFFARILTHRLREMVALIKRLRVKSE